MDSITHWMPLPHPPKGEWLIMDKHCRICHNTSCSNHGKNISFLGEGWKCNYIPVPTNAERIRAMSDEELAKLLDYKLGCPAAGDCTKMSKDCKACWLDWLQKPADEG